MRINLVVTVLQKCVEFLTLKEIFQLIRLNRYFYKNFKNNQVNYCIGLNTLSTLTQIKINSDNFKQVFYDYTGIQINSALDIPHICRFAKNLIPNPCGANNFRGWIRLDGGDGWAIQDYSTFQGNSHCFVSSYQWGSLLMYINLPRREIRRKLIIGSPVCRTKDCVGKVKLRVLVTNQDGNKKLLQKIAAPKSGNSPSPFPDPWELLSLSLDLDDNDIKAKVKFSGKDDKYWAGNFGPRFGYCYARILAMD
jgi:hypothetical protein